MKQEKEKKKKKRDTGTGCLKKEKTAKFIKSPPQPSKQQKAVSRMAGGNNEQAKKKQPKEKPPKHPCLRCRKDVTNDQKSVQCQTSQYWVHAECQGISDELFTFLVEGEGVCWNCNSCLASSARLERTVIAFEARLKETETLRQ